MNVHTKLPCSLPGRNPSKSAVRGLRAKVTEVVREWYLNDHYLDKVSVRKTVQATHMTLNAYISEIKDKQWASCVEVAASLQILKAAAAIHIKKTCLTAGEKPSLGDGKST